MTGGKKDCLYLKSLCSGRGARIQAVSKLAHNGVMIAYEFNDEEFHIPINHASRITPICRVAFAADADHPAEHHPPAKVSGAEFVASLGATPVKETVTTTVKKGWPKGKPRGKRSKPVANAS